jgi:DNA (cytosine-5)-methyltransferase 1
MRGIIVDSFAGGGGTSSGLEEAGLVVDYAINHDADAIAMYKINHPGTFVYNENIWEVDPREVAKGRPVHLAWFSPDCKHHSRARGGKPREKNIRSLAWVTARWAATVHPEVIILENVVEFQEWGPLTKDGQPDPKQKGRTFNTFVNALKKQGYKVEFRELIACDYGAPTIRKRFFMIARCDGKPIVWPKPTHGDPDSMDVRCGILKPWRTAAECIDWSIKCPSIFSRKKALADNTQRRIAKGLDKFALKNPKPYIVQVNHGGDAFRGQKINEPMPTVTAKHGFGIVAPTLAQIGQTGGGDRLHGIEDPLSTIVSKQEHMLAAPTLIQYHGEKSDAECRGQSIKEPIMTLDTSNRYGLAAAYISKYFGGFYDGAGSDIEDPMHTVTSVDHNALVTAYISRQFGQSIGSKADAPLGTITAGGMGKSQVIAGHLVKLKGDNIGQAATDPLQTITAGGLHFGEVNSFLTTHYGSEKDIGQETDQPLRTVVSKDRFGLISVKVKTAGDLGNWPKIRDLLNKYCGYSLSDNEILLLLINGIYYFIYDLGMRMLGPRELYNAQGFSPDYIIDFLKPNGKPYSKAAQVARCGNAVPPPFAKALAQANLPEFCENRKQVC